MFRMQQDKVRANYSHKGPIFPLNAAGEISKVYNIDGPKKARKYAMFTMNAAPRKKCRNTSSFYSSCRLTAYVRKGRFAQITEIIKLSMFTRSSWCTQCMLFSQMGAWPNNKYEQWVEWTHYESVEKNNEGTRNHGQLNSIGILFALLTNLY